MEKYLREVEKSEEFIEWTADEKGILRKIEKALGSEFASDVETLLGCSAAVMGEQMYLKGLKDGAKLFS